MEANEEKGLVVYYDPQDAAHVGVAELQQKAMKERAKKLGENIALVLATGRPVVVDGLFGAVGALEAKEVALVIRRVSKRYGNVVRMAVDEKGKTFLYVARFELSIAELFGSALMTEAEKREAKKEAQ